MKTTLKNYFSIDFRHKLGTRDKVENIKQIEKSYIFKTQLESSCEIEIYCIDINLSFGSPFYLVYNKA